MRKTTLIVLAVTLSIISSGCDSEPSTTVVNDPVASNSEPSTPEMSAMEQLSRGYDYDKAQDYKDAMKWYRLAAEQGMAEAEYAIAVLYNEGKGVPQDEEEAVTWFRKSAEQGFHGAKYNLGNKYYRGQGVAQDYKEAMKWFRLAAEQGGAEAKHNLGVMYLNGLGVPQDSKEGVTWFREAAEQGFPDAQYNLGSIYFNGQGVPPDYKEAYIWMKLAAGGGNIMAEKYLDIVKAQLTPAQLDEALKQATDRFNQIEEMQ